MKPVKFEDLDTLYPVDLDEYCAAAIEGAEELHFTLDGQEGSMDGSNK